MSNYRPRLSAELTPEQAERLFEILPHGWQRPLFQTIVDGLIELYDRGGIEALGAIISKSIQINQIICMSHRKGKREAMKLIEHIGDPDEN